MGYCRRWERTCEWCLRSRTLHIAPTEEGYEAIFVKHQMRKQEKTSCAEFNGWKAKVKCRKQYMKNFKKHQDSIRLEDL